MKNIQIEDDLYQYIASQTQNIGESASQILRRLLLGDENAPIPAVTTNDKVSISTQTESVAEQVIETETITEKADTQSDVFNLLNKEEVATQKGAVGKFLFILAALHRAHPNQFSKVLEVKGRERNYFATSLKELEAHGHSVKPKAITDSNYWVVTNNNTPRKKLIINEVALALGYEIEQAEKLRDFI